MAKRIARRGHAHAHPESAAMDGPQATHAGTRARGGTGSTSGPGRRTKKAAPNSREAEERARDVAAARARPDLVERIRAIRGPLETAILEAAPGTLAGDVADLQRLEKQARVLGLVEGTGRSRGTQPTPGAADAGDHLALPAADAVAVIAFAGAARRLTAECPLDFPRGVTGPVLRSAVIRGEHARARGREPQNLLSRLRHAPGGIYLDDLERLIQYLRRHRERASARNARAVDAAMRVGIKGPQRPEARIE